MQTDYAKQATDFLAASNLEFRAVLVGDDCPRFCEDALKDRDMDLVNVYPRKTHIHGKHYRCTISGKTRGHISFDFWNSYADEEYRALGSMKYRRGETQFKWDRVLMVGQGIAGRDKWGNDMRSPKAYDLLACLTKSDPGTFEDFCWEYGYDNDSRRAEDTFYAVVEEWRKVRRFFTDAEIEQLQEIS